MSTNVEIEALEIQAWVGPLQHIETLTRTLRLGVNLNADLREAYETQLGALQAELPAAIAQPLRTRMKSGQRLVTAMRGGQCSACCMRIPRGDQPVILRGQQVVCCQYCGVLLHAEKAEEISTSA